MSIKICRGVFILICSSLALISRSGVSGTMTSVVHVEIFDSSHESSFLEIQVLTCAFVDFCIRWKLRFRRPRYHILIFHVILLKTLNELCNLITFTRCVGFVASPRFSFISFHLWLVTLKVTSSSRGRVFSVPLSTRDLLSRISLHRCRFPRVLFECPDHVVLCVG